MSRVVLPLAAVALAAAGAVAQCIPGIRIDYGRPPTAGKITAPNKVDCYWFQGAQGEVVRLARRHNNNVINCVVEVQQPDRTQLTFLGSSSIIVDFTVKVTGPHYLLVRDASLTWTGDYAFALQRLSAPVGAAMLCYSSQATRGRIASLAEIDCFAFPAKKDAKLQIAKVWNNNVINVMAEVIDTTGKLLASGSSNLQTFEFTPPADGTYYLYVRDASLAWTGDYSVRLSCLAAHCGCTALARQVGSGWPGTGNVVPELSASAPPRLGTTTRIRIGNSSGMDGVPALLLIAGAEADLVTQFDGRLHVDMLTAVGIVLPSVGLSVPVYVPNEPFLYCDLCLYFQTVQLDGGASKGLSFSKGLHLVFGS